VNAGSCSGERWRKFVKRLFKEGPAIVLQNRAMLVETKGPKGGPWGGVRYRKRCRRGWGKGKVQANRIDFLLITGTRPRKGQ